MVYLEHCQTFTMERLAKRYLPSALKKNSCIFRKWNFLALVLRNYLYFLKRKIFLYFSKRKPRKKFLMFQETELSCISGSTFQSSKNKKAPLLIRRNNNKIDSIEKWC